MPIAAWNHLRRPEHLVHCYVRVVDELGAIAHQPGAWQLHPLIDRLLNADDLPEEEEASSNRHEAIQQLLARYRSEVEIPAMESLRNLNAYRRSLPGALRRDPVAFSAAADDPSYYAKVLDGIDLHLPDELDLPPRVNSLALGISWPPGHRLRTRPISAVIAGGDGSSLVLYVGSYRPGLPHPGFYLVYDSADHKVAVVPPLPCNIVNFYSHRNIGGGVALAGHRDMSGGGCYVLAELLLRKGDDPHRNWGFCLCSLRQARH